VSVSPLDRVIALFRRGAFTEALASLDALPLSGDSRVHADVVRAELLERVGRVVESRHLIERVRRLRLLTPADESACEFVLGQIAWESTGTAEKAIEHVQRSVSLARQADDLHRLCHAQLRLMVMVADRAGPRAVAPLLAEVRWHCVRLGDPHESAALHVFLAEAEAKRGLIDTASRHLDLGLRLIGAVSNPWLTGLAENTYAALAIMRSDVESGLLHARRAVALADESGAAALKRAALANLGNVLHLLGDDEQAVRHWERALAVLPSAGERSHAMLESLASVHATQGRLAEAEAILARIDDTVSDVDAQLYGNRYARLALARLRGRQGATVAAFALIEAVLAAAERADDILLESQALVARAELLGRSGARREALTVLDGLADRLPRLPPEVLARYEGALAACARAEGESGRPDPHLRRAGRVWAGLDHAPARREAQQDPGAEPWTSRLRASRIEGYTPIEASRAIVQDVATLLQHAGHPVLLATAIVDLLASTASVAQASASTSVAVRDQLVLASFEAAVLPGARLMPVRTYALGTWNGKSIEVTCQPWCDVEAVATVNAVAMLVERVHRIERANADREERLTMWSTDELPDEPEGPVVAGRMKEVLTLAHRVAPTSAGVLLTGESGTGKEIVARAIHRQSGRASKPFVPFNCAAVPKELVESLLFGHRRGAFTGADRDQPGPIRAAHGGTLFLDEVGDLSLEIQPKLLRFLELGEITPLGELHTVRVDTRIVAATNANLEQMVREGRFRDDLFYRLNIVGLTIPPLRDRRDEIPALVHHFVAKAAVEFSNGTVRVADETLNLLVLYRWPGNVRQLNNELRRIVALADEEQTLTPEMLSPEIRRALHDGRPSGSEVTVPLGDKLTSALANVEREMIRAALRAHKGRVDQTAKALGISRKGLYLKRQRFGL